MDHKLQRPLRLEGKIERRLSPLNPLSAFTNNSNTPTTTKSEENTYIQSHLRKSIVSEPEEIENLSIHSKSSTSTPTSTNNNIHNNSVSSTLATPSNNSSTNGNIRNNVEEGVPKRKSVNGITPSLRRLSRCLSEANNEIAINNNEDQVFSMSSAVLSQSSTTSVRPIPIPNPLPLRRISRCSISLENDENTINSSSSYANMAASVKSNATNTTLNNQPLNNTNSYQSITNNNNNSNINNNNNSTANLSSSMFATNSISSSFTSNNSFISNNSAMSNVTTIAGNMRKYSNFTTNPPLRRRSRGLSFNNISNVNSHNYITNSKNFKNLAHQTPQNDEIFAIDDDMISDDPKPPYPARLYALSSSSPCIYPIFKNVPSSNLSTPNQPFPSFQNQLQIQMTPLQNSASSSRKQSIDNRDRSLVTIIIDFFIFKLINKINSNKIK